MVTIHVSQVAGSADTTAQANAMWVALHAAVNSSDIVIVSFAGVSTATSSFVNSSFLRLLEIMPFEEVKRRIKIVNSTRQINEMLRNRLIRASNEVCAA